MDFREDSVHKSPGKAGMVIMKRTDHGTIQMKRSTKIGPVDAIVETVPKEDCVSRLENWRSLLKAKLKVPGPEAGPRRIRLAYEGDQLVLLALWVDVEDIQVWDSEPLDWTGSGWVPFYAQFRPKEIA